MTFVFGCDYHHCQHSVLSTPMLSAATGLVLLVHSIHSVTPDTNPHAPSTVPSFLSGMKSRGAVRGRPSDSSCCTAGSGGGCLGELGKEASDAVKCIFLTGLLFLT